MTMQLYADANGYMIQAQHPLADPVEFCSQGGGFVKKMPKDKFLTTFKPAKIPDFHPARFSIEGMPEGMVLEGYTNDQRWNGWAMPYLPKAQADRLLQGYPDIKYDASQDAFIVNPDAPEDEREVYKAIDITVDGQNLKVYAIGAGSWCWDRED